MQCPQCEFENMPGRTECFKCGSVLEVKQAIEVTPIRMSGWKRPFRRAGRRFRQYDITGISNGRISKIKLPPWIRIASFDAFVGIFFSIIPGLAHVIQKRFKEIRWYCLVWLIFLGPMLFLYGGDFGMAFYGLAIGLHAWIAMHGSFFKVVPQFFRRVLFFVMLALGVFGLYRFISATVLSDFILERTNISIPYYNITAGDTLLARRSLLRNNPLARGDIVLVHLSTLRLYNNRVGPRYGTYHGGTVMAEIVGLPGEEVKIQNEVFIVDGLELDQAKFPVPRWLRNQDLLIRIPRGEYFINVQYTGNLRRSSEVIQQACVFSGRDIEARAFMIWLPLSKRAFLEEN